MLLEDLLEDLAREITPTPEEVEKINSLAETYRDRAESLARELVEDSEALIGGSVRKGTTLKGDVDIDIFVLLPSHLPRERFEEIGLEIGRRTFEGYNPTERYSEHPYLEQEIHGVVVSIIPAYKVKPGSWRSAVDRTLYHVEYILKRLQEPQKREVRLLKRFMKGIGVYGAEVAVKGFSGYLCELLIIAYHNFKGFLEEVREWKPQIVLDIEGHYMGDLKAAGEAFEGQPLVVIDPVDRRRNVAASVSLQVLARLVSAVNHFLSKPTREFFFPPPTRALAGLEERLLSRDGLIALSFHHGRMVEDILQPQLERFAKKIMGRLGEQGFTTFRYRVYSDYEDVSYILLDLQSSHISRHRLKKGPTPFRRGDEDAFLGKNIPKARDMWISEDARWSAIIERGETEAKAFIKDVVDKGDIIPHGIRRSVKESFQVLDHRELLSEAEKDSRLRRYLEDFLGAWEFWIYDR